MSFPYRVNWGGRFHDTRTVPAHLDTPEQVAAFVAKLVAIPGWGQVDDKYLDVGYWRARLEKRSK